MEKWRDSIETVRNPPIIHLYGSEAEPFLRGSRTADAETLQLNDTNSHIELQLIDANSQES